MIPGKTLVIIDSYDAIFGIFFTVAELLAIAFLIIAILFLIIMVLVVVNIIYYRYRKKIQTPRVAVYDEIEHQADLQTGENSTNNQFQQPTDDSRTEISQNDITQSSMETSRNIAYGHFDVLVVYDTVQSN